MTTAVYLSINARATNRPPLVLLDQARRQANFLGPVGFAAMRGQTDERYLLRGTLRLVFRLRQDAIDFQQRVDQNCDPAISTVRKKVVKKPRKKLP